MKVSFNWLQEYFEEKLPAPDELADLLTFHAFEIEEVEKVGEDYVIDVDVLPNRSSDSLSHIGIARETATLLDKDLKKDSFKKELRQSSESKLCNVNVADKTLCSRYAIAIMTDVQVGQSPDWLKQSLETLGQRSINNVVDATNFVMLNLGQPLHAFDLDKLEGSTKNINIRSAKEGEKITTLTDDEYELDGTNLLITDGNVDVPIGIAGVKGGKVAEVDENTKNIVVESAHFNSTSVRKTSQTLKLWTDASIRFQNNLSSKLVGYALEEVVTLIENIASGKLEGITDVDNSIREEKNVSVTLAQINNLLGTSLNVNEVKEIFRRLQFNSKVKEEEFFVVPPFYRTDINIHEDVIEEVGRVYGYEHLEAKQLPAFDIPIEIHKPFCYADKIRNILASNGFSEVFGYTFRDKGDFEAITALASDKSYLRTNLTDGIIQYLEKNHKNAPLFGVDRVRIFEIGNVFPKSGEHSSLTLGISGKKTDGMLNEIKQLLEEKLSVKISENPKDGVLEINFSKLLDMLSEVDKYDEFEKNEVQFTPISPYPFMLRDIAVWVPSAVSESDVSKIIKDNAGEYLVRSTKFDEFEKDGRMSYAYHLVFQSNDRTLTDIEINTVMAEITEKLHKNDGFEVR